ncbi:MAG: DUF2934 domain-containing protein [Nitrospira sp.]|nr:DUF2934 domain-containing protein [Nitrospira sp.]
MSLHDEIAKVAAELYEKSGRIEGRDLENWLEAERIVMARHTVKKKSVKKTPRAVTKKKK